MSNPDTEVTGGGVTSAIRKEAGEAEKALVPFAAASRVADREWGTDGPDDETIEVQYDRHSLRRAESTLALLLQSKPAEAGE